MKCIVVCLAMLKIHQHQSGHEYTADRRNERVDLLQNSSRWWLL